MGAHTLIACRVFAEGRQCKRLGNAPRFALLPHACAFYPPEAANDPFIPTEPRRA